MKALLRHLLLWPPLALALCAGAAYAQSGTPKIGFVDIPYVIDRAPLAREASARLEKEFAPKQQIIQDLRAGLKDKRERLEKDGLIMTEEQRNELERDIRRDERNLRRDEQDFREELNIQKNKEFKNVRLSVMQAINHLAKEGNFDLILGDGVLYSSKSLDLTERVLQYMESTQDAGQ